MRLPCDADSSWSPATDMGQISSAAGNDVLRSVGLWRSRGGSVILSRCDCMHGVSTCQGVASIEQRHEGWDIGLLLDRNRIAEEQDTGHSGTFVVQIIEFGVDIAIYRFARRPVSVDIARRVRFVCPMISEHLWSWYDSSCLYRGLPCPVKKIYFSLRSIELVFLLP